MPAETADDRDMFSQTRLYLAKKNPSVMEGVMLASFLCLDAEVDEENRILRTALPNSDPVTMRFPALHIDHKIFQGKNNEPHFPVCMLERMSNSLPPTLLLRAADIQTRKLKLFKETMAGKHGYITCRDQLHLILKLLQRSDRPSLVTTLLAQYIMNDSESSSWHRMIMSPPFLKRLAASHTQACLSNFADSVTSKLDEQSRYAVSASIEAHDEGEKQDGSLTTAPNKVCSRINQTWGAVSHPQLLICISSKMEANYHIYRFTRHISR